MDVMMPIDHHVWQLWLKIACTTLSPFGAYQKLPLQLHSAAAYRECNMHHAAATQRGVCTALLQPYGLNPWQAFA